MSSTLQYNTFRADVFEVWIRVKSTLKIFHTPNKHREKSLDVFRLGETTGMSKRFSIYTYDVAGRSDSARP